MSESEKRLRELILERTYSDAAKTQYEADIEALKAAARDAVLEEVAMALVARRDQMQGRVEERGRRIGLEQGASIARALKSQPARQYVDGEKVREVLLRMRADGRRGNSEFCDGQAETAEAIAQAFGVDLDAEEERCRNCNGDNVQSGKCEGCGMRVSP